MVGAGRLPFLEIQIAFNQSFDIPQLRIDAAAPLAEGFAWNETLADNPNMAPAHRPVPEETYMRREQTFATAICSPLRPRSRDAPRRA
jgi:hypothetical protein